MFKFMKEFRIVTVIDGAWLRSFSDEKKMEEEVEKQFEDVTKHFNIAYTKCKRRVIDIPPEVRNRGNVVAFGTGRMLQLSWRCATTPENWEKFKTNSNDYVENKNYAMFTVYDTP